MNDAMSLLLATTVLALGGLGLYMYKSSDDNQKGGKYDDDYDEDNLFGSGSLWGSSNEDDEAEHVENDYDEEIYEARAKSKSKPKASKTKRRRVGGGTKRRY
jgi:hypothetical protein